MATLKDVAKLACVDVSTVSRALNNTSYVHPDTKERIYAAAKELGYHPNVMAQALRQGKRHTIGVIVPSLFLSVFAGITLGIEQEAQKQNYGVLLCCTSGDPVIAPQKADMSGAKLVEIMHRIVPGCFVICHNAVHMGNLVPDNLNDRNA